MPTKRAGRIYFYPRPPRGGRLEAFRKYATRLMISIHALREEGDVLAMRQLFFFGKFLSTPSARRATHPDQRKGQVRSISIHALREEGDISGGTNRFSTADFYPRPPRGGRHRRTHTMATAKKFLSTPSARRATAKTETKSLFSNKLYNILHEFRRALIYNGSKSYPNHAK